MNALPVFFHEINVKKFKLILYIFTHRVCLVFLLTNINTSAVGLYATIGPIIFILLIELLNAKLLPFQYTNSVSLSRRRRKFLICLFHGLSLFVLGIAITLCLTEIGKKWVGRLRPHFISVCDPDWSTVACTSLARTGNVHNAINTGNNFCRGKKKDIDEARLSFPSGHSSFSVYAMLFLIIYVEARLFLLRLRYLKPLIQMTAFIAAFVTCLSRISDYHHRGTDVLGGSALGAVIAYFITFFVGRVLWEYEVDKTYSDFDLKPGRNDEMYRI
jgi:phosphatidate phosphatase